MLIGYFETVMCTLWHKANKRFASEELVIMARKKKRCPLG